MFKRLDLRSALLGAVLAVGAMLLLGAGRYGSTSAGRFQMTANEHHVYILDTANGRVWQAWSNPDATATDANFDAAKLGVRRPIDDAPQAQDDEADE